MNIRSVVWASLLLLAGCGGGGGNPGKCMASAQTCAAVEAGNSGMPPAPSSSTVTDAAGLYHGTTTTGRTAAALVQTDGTFWLLYAPAGQPATLAGAEQGHLTGADGRFAAADLIDIGVESGAIASGTLAGSYTIKSSIASTATFGDRFVEFSGTYDSASGTPATLAAIAGSYSGTGIVLGASESTQLTVSATGVIAGSGAGGCSFTGTAIPNPGVNTYSVTISFGGAPCPNAINASIANSTVSGVAAYEPATRRLTSAALNPARTNGFLFAGTKG